MSRDFGQGHALVIGVGADLPNTVDDAIGLADILKDPTRCAYPPNQVHLLTAEQGKNKNSRARAREIARSNSENTCKKRNLLRCLEAFQALLHLISQIFELLT